MTKNDFIFATFIFIYIRKFRIRHSSRKRSSRNDIPRSFRNKSRSRSSLGRSEQSRRSSLIKEHHQTGTRYQSGNNKESEPISIYSSSRNIPMHMDANNSFLKSDGERRSFEFGTACLTYKIIFQIIMIINGISTTPAISLVLTLIELVKFCQLTLNIYRHHKVICFNLNNKNKF